MDRVSQGKERWMIFERYQVDVLKLFAVKCKREIGVVVGCCNRWTGKFFVGLWRYRYCFGREENLAEI